MPQQDALGQNIAADIVADLINQLGIPPKEVQSIVADIKSVTDDAADVTKRLRSIVDKYLPLPQGDQKMLDNATLLALEDLGLFHRQPKTGGPLELRLARVGINWNINNNASLTADQKAMYKQALNNPDILTTFATEAGAANIAAPAPGTRDWSGFFTALGNFMVQIMPRIEQLIKAFTGGAVVAAVWQTTVDLTNMGSGKEDLPRKIVIPSFISGAVISELEAFGAAELAFLETYIKGRLATAA